jgi:hypothetical protein
METIGGFLERYKNFIPPPLAAARAVRAAILEVLGIGVAENAIKVRSGKADVGVGPIEKSEILMHKDKILTHTRNIVGDTVRDIR